MFLGVEWKKFGKVDLSMAENKVENFRWIYQLVIIILNDHSCIYERPSIIFVGTILLTRIVKLR